MAFVIGMIRNENPNSLFPHFAGKNGDSRLLDRLYLFLA